MDLTPYLTHEGEERRDAATRLAKLFREGLDDAIAIPEVHTTAEDVTHAILGCTWHTTMIILVDAAHQVDPEIAQRIKDNVNSVINGRLYVLAMRALNAGKPLGPNHCGVT